MPLVLVIGDLNIPYKAIDIPPQFKKLLVPGKIQQILCTGNVNYKNSVIMDYLRSVCAEQVMVSGPADLHFNNENFGEGTGSTITSSKIVQIGSFRIGIINGYQLVPANNVNVMSIHARSNALDIMITGNTGRFECFEVDNCIYLNPGSMTLGEDGADPSFALMDVNGKAVTIYVYRLNSANGVVVEKLDFHK